MCKGVVFCIAVLMFILNGDSDIMLNHFKTELGDWRRNMTKAWHGYIRMCLFQYYKNKTHFYKHYGRNFLFHLVEKSKSLLLVNKRRKVHEKWRPHRSLVKWPIGQLFLTEKPCNLLYWCLSYQLRLNLTIYTIQASHNYIVNFFIYHSYQPYRCGDPYLSNNSPYIYYSPLNGFRYPFSGHYPRFNCSKQNPLIEYPYKFSGHHSMFNFYPLGRNVVICRECFDFGLENIKVEGEFTILDRHYLFNSGGLEVKITDINISSILKYAFHPHTHYHLFRFYVAVRKLDKIIIWMNESVMFRYIVFDGPGLLSDTLHKSGNYLTTTTFQALVLVWNSYGTTNNFVVFASKSLSISRSIIINENENSLFHFPDDNCKKGLCTLLVRTHLDYHVNITVISLKSKILNDLNGCFYAGIAMGERFNFEYKQIKTICESNNNSIGQSIYSYDSSLILMVYWYKGYSKMNTSVIISQTKCKSVLLELCWMHHLCFIHKASYKCHAYLYNVTRFSGVLLNFYEDISAFVLNSEDCAILQFSKMHLNQNIVYPYVYDTICYIGLILKHSVDIAVSVSHNQTDFSFVETKLDFCDDIKSYLKCVSEPLIPRVVETSKEVLRSGQEVKGEVLVELIRNRLIMGVSWIELAISSNNQSTVKSNLRRFAEDFLLNKTYFHLGNKLTVSHTALTIILLKSNIKVFDPNISISLTVDIYAVSFYNEEEICE